MTTTVRPAYCGLLPHPPIVVPEVGRERLADCRATHDACMEFASRLTAARPDRLFLVSPHSPRTQEAFGLWTPTEHHGDLSRFGAPGAAVRLPNDPEGIAAVDNACERAGLATWSIPPAPLDHGAVVPLWFLQTAGWHGPTGIASLPWSADPALMVAFGTAVGEALARVGGRPAIVASGDMTHRALPGAPAGFHPRAVDFDRTMTDLVARGRLSELPRIDPALRELAAEDAADSATIACAAIGFEGHGVEVLSYEHPFGVGYLVAVFHDGKNEHD